MIRRDIELRKAYLDEPPMRCVLLGLGQGRLHLAASKPVDPDVRIVVTFQRVTLEAIVEYSRPKDREYRICASVTTEIEQRRKEPRLPIHQEATISLLDNGRVLDSVLTDISRSGARVRLNETLKVGTTVCIETNTTMLAGEVRYCRKVENQFEAGIETTDIVTSQQAPEHKGGFMEELRWKLAAFIVGERLNIAKKFLR